MRIHSNDFPVLQNCIYANTAGTGLMHKGLLEWRRQHDLDYLNGGSQMKFSATQTVIPETRRTVAQFFNCDSENVALVQNFSVGLNFLLEGLPGATRVLLLDNDYPSVNWPFEDRGFPVSYAKIDASLEENIWEKLRKGNISVLALSLVQWQNGIKIDLDFLKKVKLEFPDLIIIADGTQFCGMQAIDFKDSGIDVLGASAYKWLLAGYGNGFLLFKEHVIERFKVKAIGCNTVNANMALRHTARFVKHFEPGHLDTLNFGSLKYALDFLAEIGMAKITEHNQMISAKAKKEFAGLGLLNDDVIERKDHSTIFNIKGDDRLFEYVSKEKVVCAQRGKGIRFSFHFYNTENDVYSIIEILKSRS